MSIKFGNFEDLSSGKRLVVRESEGLVGRSAECAIFVDKDCKNVSRKQMKFYLDAEQSPWIVNVGSGNAECLVSGERCLIGEPLRLKPGDILEVGCSSNRYKYLPFGGEGEKQSMNGSPNAANGGVQKFPAGHGIVNREHVVPAMHKDQEQVTKKITAQRESPMMLQPPARQLDHDVAAGMLPSTTIAKPLTTKHPAPPPPPPPLPQSRLLPSRGVGPAPPPPPPPLPKASHAGISTGKAVLNTAGINKQPCNITSAEPNMGLASRQEFLQQIAERARETNQRLRNQPLTCVSIANPAVQRASMAPTEAELQRVRAALRQTMMARTSEEEAPSLRPSGSVPPDPEEHTMRASSAWSMGSAQQPTQHWACQNVLLPIPGTPGSVRISPPTPTPVPPAEHPPPQSPADASPALLVRRSGSEIADAWIRSPAGEGFMTAMVAADVMAMEARQPTAEDDVLHASSQPSQLDQAPAVPGSEIARKTASFSFAVLPGSGVVSPAAIGAAEHAHEISLTVPADESTPTSPTEAKVSRLSGQSIAVTHSVSCQPVASPATGLDRQAASQGSGGAQVSAALALAQANLNDLRQVISEVQQLLPETDAPQALADVHSFVAAVRKRMVTPPAEAPVTPEAARCAPTPGSVSLLKGLDGRGLGVGKGLCLQGRRSSSAPSGVACTPMAGSTGMPSVTNTTVTGVASTASICTTPTECVWEPQGPDFGCPVDSPEKMVGLSVWRHYEQGGWLQGSVHEWQPYSRVHTIVYLPGTKHEFSEFVNLEQRVPRNLLSWRDPAVKVSRPKSIHTTPHASSSQARTTAGESEHMSGLPLHIPQSSLQQFSFWPQTGATPANAPPDLASTPLGRRSCPPMSTDQAQMSAQIPAPLATGTPLWPRTLTGTPQECGNTLLHMLSSPEGQSLSPELRFTLGSAIRSAQWSLVDPNAEFTEPLSPPIWHPAPDVSTVPDASTAGFGWLNTVSHFVSNTPPVLPTNAVATTPADVEMHDAAEPVLTDVSHTPQAVANSHAEPGPPPSSQPSGDASCRSLSSSPLQQQGSSASAAGRSPSLALPVMPQTDRPVSPLSVAGLPPGPPGQAASEGLGPAPSAPVPVPKSYSGQISFGARLGVGMYESPESTTNTAKWQVTEDAGTTPFMACPGASPDHSVSAQAAFPFAGPLRPPDTAASVGCHESGQSATHTVSTLVEQRAGTPIEVPTPSICSGDGVCGDTPARSDMPNSQVDTASRDELDVEARDKHSGLFGDLAQYPSAQGEAPAAVPGCGPPAEVCKGQLTSAGMAGSPERKAQHEVSTAAAMSPLVVSQGGPTMSPNVAGENAEQLHRLMPPSRSEETAPVLQATLLPVSQHEQIPSALPLTISPALIVQSFDPPGTPFESGQAGTGAVTPATASVGAASLPPATSATTETPPPRHGVAMLNLSVLELPPCSRLAQAGTPHPTPTDTAALISRVEAAVPMSALHHAMLRAGIVANGSPLAAASPAAPSVQSPALAAAEDMSGDIPAAYAAGGTPDTCNAPVSDIDVGMMASSSVSVVETTELSVAALDQGATLSAPLSPLHADAMQGTHAALALIQTPLAGDSNSEPMAQVHALERIHKAGDGAEPDQSVAENEDAPETDGQGLERAGDVVPRCDQDDPGDGLEVALSMEAPQDELANAGHKVVDNVQAQPLADEEQQQPGSPESAPQTAKLPRDQEQKFCDELAQGQISESVQETLIQNESPPPSEARSQPDAESEDQADDGGPNGKCDQKLPVYMASPEPVAGGDAAADTAGTGGEASIARMRTQAKARAAQAAEGTHVPGEAAPGNNSDQNNGKVENSGVDVVPSSSHEDKADVLSRPTQAAPIALATEDATEEAGPARRTRASSGVLCEPVELKFPLKAKAPRTQRSRRGHAETTDSAVSTGPPSSSAGRVLRPRTRANSTTTAATRSVETENTSDCENHSPENAGTSKLRQVEQADDVTPQKFVATLSPIPENRAAQRAKDKEGAKRKRAVKDIGEVSQEGPRRTTRRVTRSQDTS